MPDVACNPSANECKKGDRVINGNGVRTGKCVPYHYPNGTTTDTCEIEAWCPVEYNMNPTFVSILIHLLNMNYRNTTAILKDAERFTVLIKNTAAYSKFHFFKRNILESSNTSYLKGCLYNKHSDPFCPVFKLGDIVTATGEDFNALAYSGGVIAIFINWDCNLDNSWDDCRPTYKFKRLDNKNSTLAKGYNFRFSNYYQDANGIDTRTLLKAYGILFKVIVTGTAGQCSGVQVLLYLGSGFGFFTVVS
ncbi:P2X purinoceptor 4-like [Patiria miniata]|uniref:Purinergic receptor n=1 Tax=Patiria miniata TaxID=46514 RepID=A0A914A4R1_PATMI|nr:P2X purinoceptor 4-like [Patiria miniata]